MDSVGGAIGVAIILGLIFCADKMFSYAAFFLSLTITTISIVLPVGIILFLIPFTLVNNKKAYQGVIEITDRSIKRDRVKEIRTVSRKKLRNSIIIVCVLLIFESYQFVKTIRFREELAGKSFLNGEMTDFGTLFATEHEYTDITLDFDKSNKCSIYRLVFWGYVDKKDLPGELIGVYDYYLFPIVTGNYIMFIDREHIYKIEADNNVPQGFSFITSP